MKCCYEYEVVQRRDRDNRSLRSDWPNAMQIFCAYIRNASIPFGAVLVRDLGAQLGRGVRASIYIHELSYAAV